MSVHDRIPSNLDISWGGINRDSRIGMHIETGPAHWIDVCSIYGEGCCIWDFASGRWGGKQVVGGQIGKCWEVRDVNHLLGRSSLRWSAIQLMDHQCSLNIVDVASPGWGLAHIDCNGHVSDKFPGLTSRFELSGGKIQGYWTYQINVILAITALNCIVGVASIVWTEGDCPLEFTSPIWVCVLRIPNTLACVWQE